VKASYGLSKRSLTAFKRPSRVGPTSYATNWPATNVFMPAAFDIVDMHKNIGAAAIGHDEA